MLQKSTGWQETGRDMAGGVETESVFQLRAEEIVVMGKGEVRWGVRGRGLTGLKDNGKSGPARDIFFYVNDIF